jgi:hypothetical protein
MRDGIPDKHQLEARQNSKVLMHVAGGNTAFVAGELLDLADRPAAVFLRLGRDHQPGVRQAGELAQVLVMPETMNWLIGATSA